MAELGWGAVPTFPLADTETGTVNSTFTLTATAQGNEIETGTISSTFSFTATAIEELPYIYDYFNRANSSSTLGDTDTGQTWQYDDSTWGISSNKAYRVSTETGIRKAYLSDVGTLDFTLECDVTLSSSRAYVGVCIRNNGATDDGLMIRLRKHGAFDSVLLYNTVIASSLDEDPAFGLTLGQTYRLKVIASGADVDVYIDNVLTLSASADTLNSAGREQVGVLISYGASTEDDNGSRIDNFEVFADVATWSPTDWTDLTSWYDVSDSGARTLSGSNITTLDNKEGTAARDLLQTTDANRPSVLTAEVNGLDVASFNGSSDYMTHTGDNLYAAAGHMVAVLIEGAAQSDKHIIGEADTGGPGIATFLRSQNPNVNGAPDAYYQIHGASVQYAGFDDGTITFQDSSPHVVVIVDTGSGITHYVDGSQSSTHAYTRSGSVTTTAFTIGCLNFNGSQLTFWAGNIGELLGGTGTDSTDREKIEGYLAHKWGIEANLPGGHPYKSSPP